MNIEYNIKKNYFSNYVSSQGVVLKKNSILNNKEVNISYFRDGIIFLIGFISFLTMYLLFKDNVLESVSIYLYYIICIYGIVLFSYFIGLFGSYCYDYLSKHYEGILMFNKEGIKDKCITGKEISLSWDNISALVISKKNVVFLTNKNFYFFLPSSYKEDILKAVKKYNKELRIIELNK